MFQLTLRLANHVRRYSILAISPSGWEVKFEEDQEVRRRHRYEDWHRVERARASFEREVDELQEQGWLVI